MYANENVLVDDANMLNFTRHHLAVPHLCLINFVQFVIALIVFSLHLFRSCKVCKFLINAKSWSRSQSVCKVYMRHQRKCSDFSNFFFSFLFRFCKIRVLIVHIVLYSAYFKNSRKSLFRLSSMQVYFTRIYY